MNNKTKLIFTLRMIILALLVYFLFIFNLTPKTDCEVCSFEIGEEEYSDEEFFNIYVDRCLAKPKVLGDFNLSLKD